MRSTLRLHRAGLGAWNAMPSEAGGCICAVARRAATSAAVTTRWPGTRRRTGARPAIRSSARSNPVRTGSGTTTRTRTTTGRNSLRRNAIRRTRPCPDRGVGCRRTGCASSSNAATDFMVKPGGESTLTVLVAFGANLAIAVAKTFAAVGLFVVGAAVSIWRGITELLHGAEGAEDYRLAYLVLAIAFVLEGTSLLQALRQLRREAANLERDVLEYALRTSDPTV